jgi:hypothetical protein
MTIHPLQCLLLSRNQIRVKEDKIHASRRNIDPRGLNVVLFFIQQHLSETLNASSLQFLSGFTKINYALLKHLQAHFNFFEMYGQRASVCDFSIL